MLAPLRALGKPVADIVTQAALRADAEHARRDPAQGPALLLEVALPVASIDPKAIDALIEAAASIPSPHSAAVFFQLEGALSELPAGHSPVGNRDAAFVFNATSAWDSAADDDVNVRWARDAFDAMQPFATGGTYVNFLNRGRRRRPHRSRLRQRHAHQARRAQEEVRPAATSSATRRAWARSATQADGAAGRRGTVEGQVHRNRDSGLGPELIAGSARSQRVVRQSDSSDLPRPCPTS